MSDDGTIGGTDAGDLLAAEYVLGVLGPAARRAAERKLAQDPNFAAQVSFWEAQLGGLADEVAPVPPPAKVWERIDVRLSDAPAKARAGLWQSLAFWRTLAISSAALAAASVAGLVYIAEQPAAPLVASLAEESGKPGFLAAANPADGSLTIVPAALLSGERQKAFELWLIPPGGRPHSLGLIDPAQAVQVRVPKTLLPHFDRDAVLAVSLEPPGGSPTGQPTGPVVASGKLASL